MRESMLPAVCCLVLLLPLSTSPSPLKRRVSSGLELGTSQRNLKLTTFRINTFCADNSLDCTRNSPNVVAGDLVKSFNACIAIANATTTTPTNNCLLKSKPKIVARERYCRLFNESHISLTDLAYQLMDVKVKCRLSIKGTDYKSLNDLITKVEEWRDDVRNKLNCCGGSPDFDVATRTHDQRFYTPDFFIAQYLNRKRTLAELCKPILGEMLEKIRKHMSLLENLRTLGRRTTCLRGCAGMDHVQCAVTHAN